MGWLRGRPITIRTDSRRGTALLEAIQEFELWSGLKVNRKKTCAMVVERRGTGQRQINETLVYRECCLVPINNTPYMGQEVAFLAPSTACRYLGVWGTPAGHMSNTKERIFKRTEEARDLLMHHPLTPAFIRARWAD